MGLQAGHWLSFRDQSETCRAPGTCFGSPCWTLRIPDPVILWFWSCWRFRGNWKAWIALCCSTFQAKIGIRISMGRSSLHQPGIHHSHKRRPCCNHHPCGTPVCPSAHPSVLLNSQVYFWICTLWLPEGNRSEGSAAPRVFIL